MLEERMMSLTLDPAAVQREATTQSAGEIVRYLQKTLGPQIVAYLSGLKDTKMVGLWAKGAKPRDVAGMRLRYAYQAARLLDNAYERETARAWFFGTNTRLNDEAPAYVLRYAKTPEDVRFIVPAARAFVGAAA
jgi:hypothetical protein